MDKNIMPEFKIIETPRILKKLGDFVTRTFLSPYPLSEHPLDAPIEPVTNEGWPNVRE